MCLQCGDCTSEHPYNVDDAIDASIEWVSARAEAPQKFAPQVSF